MAVCIVLLALAASGQAPDPSKLFQQALEAQHRGDDAAAIRDYQRLLKLQPRLLPAMANLGAVLAHAERFDEAIAEYQKALMIEPGNDAIRLNLALAFYKKSDWEKAAAEFEALRRSNPRDERLATLLGDCYLKLNRPAEAAQATGELAAAHPENVDLIYVNASALIRSGKRRDGATVMDTFARQVKNAEAYFLAGSTWVELNEFQRARDDLEAAEQLNPNFTGIHTLLGIARDGLGDPENAEPELRKAFEIDPKDFRANLYLGAILYKRRDLKAAGPFLERALELSPDSELARYQYALYESAMGKLDPAVSELEKIVRSNPNWLEPHVELAALYYKLHRSEEGARERATVDRLTAEQQGRGPQ